MARPNLRQVPHRSGSDASRSHEPPVADARLPIDHAAALGDEVEAFMHGRLIDYLVGASRPVPAWAVLNLLAHATVEELAALVSVGAAGPVPSSPGEPAWVSAQRSLAAELLTGAPDDVVGFQRAVLVPLELWVIRRSRSEAVSSRRALDLAADALSAVRSTM
jgi:hypothetical protein